MKTKKKLLFLSFFLCTLSFILYSCSPTEPPDKGNITLQVQEVSCTEAWLTLETQNISFPVNITLLKNNNVEQIVELSNPDTTIYIDSLLPSKTYTFQAISQSSSLNQPSNKVPVTTLDTTSHNFTFQTYTFGGEAGSSALYDVAIVKTERGTEEIWAVGEIYLKDSTGKPDPQPYGVARWNGKTWDLRKLFHNTNIPVTPRDILVLSQEEIYLAAGSIFKWDGTSSEVEIVFSRLDLSNPNGTIEKLWGNSNSLIYGVGNSGSIAFYKNGNWGRIESETASNIYDIIGYTNPHNSQIESLCAATDPNDYSKSEILRITNINKIEKINLTTNRVAGSLWTKDGFPVYLCGDGIFTNKTGKWEEIKLPVNYATSKIRGNGLNDIFVVGAFGEFLHFNGQRWQSFRNSTALSNGSYTSVALINNLVVASGYNNASAVIIFGRR